MERKNNLERINKDSIFMLWRVHVQDIMQLREGKPKPVADTWGRNDTVLTGTPRRPCGKASQRSGGGC